MCRLLLAVAFACLLPVPSLGHGQHHHGEVEHASASASVDVVMEPWEEQVAVTWAVPDRRLKSGVTSESAGLSSNDASLEEFTVQFTANGKQYNIELQRNRGLIAQGAKHTLIDRNGQKREGPMPKACYYQGTVVGDSSGRVGVSTCKGGFSGLIIAHGEMISIDIASTTEQGRIGEQDLQPSGVQHHHVRRLTDSQVLEYERDVQQFLRAPPNHTKNRRLTGSPTKYVEAFVVNDYSRYLTFGGASGLEALAEQSVSVMNTVTTLYKTDPADSASFPYVIQVVFVGQQTFVEDDPWEETVAMIGDETDCSDLLSKFHEWANDELAAGEARVSTYDNRILLSGRDFDGNTIGLAGVSVMCSSTNSGNINMCTATSAVGNCASVVSHEMGHNFGMRHDGSDNDCPTSGFIMEAITDGDATTQFSSCSAAYITTYFQSTYSVRGECLENTPTRVEGDPICGNGFVEIGEACDCGSSDCSTLNPCCDGATCQLASESYECATGDCCSDSCMFYTAESATVCRSASSTCDLAETCPGGTDECPMNRYLYPGEACTIDGYAGTCWEGTCNSLGYLCGVELTQDYSGTYDTSEVCSQFDDSCSYMVCHDADEPDNPYACTQSFALHGKQMTVPDGTPCWFPSTQYGTRTGMCYDGKCQLGEALAAVPHCGNGGIDFGEECDCGSASEDSCCECSTCMLKEGKACSSQEACCDDSCNFKAQGTECRAAEGSCDVAETCSGSSGVCPSDVGQNWGTACTASDGEASTCYGKVCVDSFDMQCDAKYDGTHPFGYSNGADGRPSTYHKCEGLMCCNTTKCGRNTAWTSFTDSTGTVTVMRIGGALDGTVLNNASEVCIHGLATAPVSSCDDGYFLSVAVGQCVACSTGCDTCHGPSVFDCTGRCKYGQDSRGACAISEHQLSLAATTTVTVTVTMGTTIPVTTTEAAATTTGADTLTNPGPVTTTQGEAGGATTTQSDTSAGSATTTQGGASEGPAIATTTQRDFGGAVPTTTREQEWVTTTRDVKSIWPSTTEQASVSVVATTTIEADQETTSTSDGGDIGSGSNTSNTGEAPTTTFVEPDVTTTEEERTVGEMMTTTTPPAIIPTTTGDGAVTTSMMNAATTSEAGSGASTSAFATSTAPNFASTSSTNNNATTTTKDPYPINEDDNVIIDAPTNLSATSATSETSTTEEEVVATTTLERTTTIEVTTTAWDPSGDGDGDGPTKTSTTKTTTTRTTTTTPAPEQVEFTSTVEGIDYNQLMANDDLQKEMSDNIVDAYVDSFGLPASCFEVEFTEGSVQVNTLITLPTEEERAEQGLTSVPSGADLVATLTDTEKSSSLQSSLVSSITKIPAIAEVTTGDISVSEFLVATTTTTTASVTTATETTSTMTETVTTMATTSSEVLDETDSAVAQLHLVKTHPELAVAVPGLLLLVLDLFI